LAREGERLVLPGAEGAVQPEIRFPRDGALPTDLRLLRPELRLAQLQRYVGGGRQREHPVRMKTPPDRIASPGHGIDQQPKEIGGEAPLPSVTLSETARLRDDLAQEVWSRETEEIRLRLFWRLLKLC